MIRSSARLLASGFVFASSLATPLGAQHLAYDRTAGDTLHFRETTRIDGVVHGAAGDNAFALTRQSTVAFAFGTGDALQAWYEAFTIDGSGALGGQHASGDSLLHVPFTLKMTPNGRVQTVHAPAIPRSMRLIAELPVQFDDFFPRLPASGATVTKGASWSDTATTTDGEVGGPRRTSIRRITHYHADHDSIVAGQRTVVITLKSELRLEAQAQMQQAPFVVSLLLTGNEDGTALFSVSQGRLLARERNGELHGALTYKGGDQPITLNQNYKYHGVVSAVGWPPSQP
jgi:hypothetical protein